MLMQEFVHGMEPVENTLGVVQPFDAHRELDPLRQPETLQHARADIGRIMRSVVGWLGPFDRDRIGMHQRRLSAVGDRRSLAIDPGFQEAIDALDEVVAVELDMESDDRAAEKPVQDLLAPRTDAEHLRVRPRDMPEGDDRRFGQPLADQPRQQGEVIILDQHDRVSGFGLLDHDLGELPVHGLIAFPVGGAENRPREGDVTQRPKPFIGKAQIVALELLLGQPHAAKRIGRIVRRHHDVVAAVDRLPVG